MHIYMLKHCDTNDDTRDCACLQHISDLTFVTMRGNTWAL